LEKNISAIVNPLSGCDHLYTYQLSYFILYVIIFWGRMFHVEDLCYHYVPADLVEVGIMHIDIVKITKRKPCVLNSCADFPV
jgi:hypothetical protein